MRAAGAAAWRGCPFASEYTPGPGGGANRTPQTDATPGRPPWRAYSYRSASIGSSAAAFRAG